MDGGSITVIFLGGALSFAISLLGGTSQQSQLCMQLRVEQALLTFNFQLIFTAPSIQLKNTDFSSFFPHF